MEGAPLNLSARDFDAHVSERAGSAASIRLDVEGRALAWARPVVARLTAVGVALELHGGDGAAGAPAITLSRAAGARRDVERISDAGRDAGFGHAALALRLDGDAVEVCFLLAADARVDADNLRARLAVELPAAELVAALEALPEQFTMGVDPNPRVACASATPAVLVGLLGRAEASRAPLVVGWRVPRETAVEHPGLLDEQLADALVALAPVYALVAWSRENDRIALAAKLAVAKRRARTASASRAAILDARRVGERAPAMAARASGTDHDGAASGPKPRAHSGTLEKGSRVRVRSGPFADKVGTISELDGRGAARVMLGLLSSRFDVAELEPVVEGRDRPTFQSSHRRPLGQTPRKAR